MPFRDAGVIHINRFFPQQGAPAFQGGFLLSSQEQAGITVADDGVHVILIQCFQLALCLQHQAG